MTDARGDARVPSAAAARCDDSRVRDAVRSARSAADVCRDALARIEALNPALHAFNTVAAERALARAAAIDRDPDRWRDAPLAGVPVALKDNLCTRGVRTTASSRILEHFVPPYDATVVVAPRGAPAPSIVGKTNCDEFAMGSSTENSAFGPARNPWALDRIPGGSSGGSAAAVAARPDAAGARLGHRRIDPPAGRALRRRRPEADLRPRVALRAARVRLVARSDRSADAHGPRRRARARRARRRRPGRRDERRRAGARLHRGADRRRPRRCASAFRARCSSRASTPRSSRAFDAALDVLRRAARRSSTSSCRTRSYAIPVYYLVATAEASSNLARYDGVRYGFRADARTRSQGPGPADHVRADARAGVRRRGEAPHHARHLRAERRLLRRVLPEGAAGAHADPARLRPGLRPRVDVVAMPTSPTPAFRIGERVADPLQMYLADVFTVSANLAGLPAISVPCGFTARPPADRPAADRPAVRRSDAAARRRRLRTRHRMVETAATPDLEPLKPADWTTLSDEKLLEVRMCDLGADDRGHRARAAHRRRSTPSSTRAAWRSGRTTGCRTSGSRRTACPASPSRSTWRIRGSRSSSSRRCSRSKAAIPNRACGSCGTRRATRSTTPTSCGGGRRGGGCSALRRPRTPSTTRRSRTARASSSISITGTRRAIPTRTSPRRSPSGSIRSRCGRRATPAGRRSGSSNTWIG